MTQLGENRVESENWSLHNSDKIKLVNIVP